MLPTHRFIARQGEYTISLRQPGFEFTPMLLGKIASFVVAGRGNGYSVFAFMYPLLATDVPDEERLIEAAVRTITAAIEAGQVVQRRERTFEYRGGAFVELAGPRWWIPLIEASETTADPEGVPTLVITGPVGVGKTTVAAEIGEMLEEAGIPHAFVDVDALRWCYPAPPGDRFRVGLAMRNLAAIWPNFRESGAGRLLLADVVESREELDNYRQAVPGAEITVVRLAASGAALAERVQQRELGAGRDWHLARAEELAALMAERRVEDLLVETDGRPVRDIAAEVLRRTGWLPDSGDI